MPQVFANAARSTLASGISDSATTITLATGGGALFPVADTGTDPVGGTAKWFRAVLDDNVNIEVIYVRTHVAAADSFSNVQRGQEGTTARAWDANDVVGLRVTAADMEPLHSMSVHRSSGANTTSAGWQKITMNATGFDTGGIWSGANTRATPTRPGYYHVIMRVNVPTAFTGLAAVYKNGSSALRVGDYVNWEVFAASGSGLIYCNGTSDYLEPYIFCTSVKALGTGATETYMQIFGPL